MYLPFGVYVLWSKKDEGFYVGYSTNLTQRISDHNCGNVSSTKTRRPLELIYCEFHKNKYDALRREKYFKTTAGKKEFKTDASGKSRFLKVGVEVGFHDTSLPKNRNVILLFYKSVEQTFIK